MMLERSGPRPIPGRRWRAAAACAVAALSRHAGPANADVTFFDDGAVALRAVLSGGVLEPGVPLYLNGVRVNDPGTPSSDVFTIVEFYDRVPGTSSYPLTFADIAEITGAPPGTVLSRMHDATTALKRLIKQDE